MRPPAALDGPLPPLPAPLDAVARVWAATSGRARALVRLVVVVVLLLAAGGGLLRGPWGPPVEVVVTTADVAAGEPLRTAGLRLERRPSDLVPPDALRSVDAVPADALATGTLPVGAVVTEAHALAGGPAATATDGTAVVAVEAGLLPPLPVGTRLDLAVPTADGSTEVAARGATLVADDGTWRWLRVGRDEVAAVAAGLTDGRLVPAVLPRRPGAGP